VVHRGHEPPARAQHPAHLREHGLRVGDEGQPTEGRARHVHAVVGERQGAGVGLHQRHGDPGGAVELRGPGEHAAGHVQGHHLGAGPVQPAGAGRGPAADLQHPPSPDVAEQVGVGLPQALGAPQEVHVAEVVAVFGQVGGGGRVPPPAVGPRGLRLPGPAAGHPAGRRVPVGAQRQLRGGRRRWWHGAPMVTRRVQRGRGRPRWTRCAARPYHGPAPEVCGAASRALAPQLTEGLLAASPVHLPTAGPAVVPVLSLRTPRPEHSTT
jgi:hypothetical protein